MKKSAVLFLTLLFCLIFVLGCGDSVPGKGIDEDYHSDIEIPVNNDPTEENEVPSEDKTTVGADEDLSDPVDLPLIDIP